MTACDAELCPYWDGHTCPCETFGIERPGPGADPSSLPSGTYEMTTPGPAEADTLTAMVDAFCERQGVDRSTLRVRSSRTDDAGVAVDAAVADLHAGRLPGG